LTKYVGDDSLKHLVMVDEIRDLSLSVNSLAAVLHRGGHGARSAGENTHFAHVAVLLLDKLQEGGHIRTSEMVDSLQSGEHAATAETLEMVLTDVQHCGSEVKLVEELGDEYVHFQHVCHVLLFHVAKHVDKPFEIAVRGTNPQKVDFFARNARVPVGGGAKHQIVEDGGVWGHADTPAHHHCHLEFVPVLVSAAKWSLDLNLRRVVLVLLFVIDGLVEAVTQLPCPRSNGLDVDREKVFMRSAG